MKSVCFRVDGGNRIGMGHVVESLTLADTLRKHKIPIQSFIVNNDPAAIDCIDRAGYHLEIIESEDEMTSIIQSLNIHNANILIADLKEKDSEYYNSLQKVVDHLIVILDDDSTCLIPADLVINFSILQNQDYYDQLCDSQSIYRVGPRFMPLSELLRRSRIERSTKIDCQTIFINQGGSDPFGLTKVIVEELELLHLTQEVFVVVGPAVSSNHVDELQRLIPSLKNKYHFEWGPEPSRVYEIMNICDLAITAAGNALYELAFLGVPSIVVCHHELHNKVASIFEESESAVNLGKGLNLKSGMIAESVKNLLHDPAKRACLSSKSMNLIDGLGADRIAEEILKLCQD